MKQFLWFVLFAFVAAVWCTPPAHAGTFKTITIDDVYTDWVGVPVVDSDGGDNTAGPDIGDTQIANDGTHLYIRNTFPNSLSLGTFVSIDVDQNSATGFDIFGLGLIGAEAGWQNDFGFAQDTGIFNSGVLSGDYFGGGHALLSPFANAGSRELAISLDALIAAGPSPIFPDNTITLLVWTDLGAGADGLLGTGDEYDVSGVIQYTLAVPEPATFTCALFALATLGIVARRRRK
jgi:hypothetical protein